MTVGLEDILNALEVLTREVEALPTKLLIKAGQIVVWGGLSDISEQLGLIRAGEFRAGNQNDIGRGFSGMRISYPPMTYNGENWNLVGVENDTLQFGVRAQDGKLFAGGGSVVLDIDGITALAGNIAGWQILSDRLQSQGNPGIRIDSNGNIQTTNFATDVRGWRISADGTAEFQNAKIRGELQTTIFTKREIQVASGSLGVFKSAGVLLEDVTATSGQFVLRIKDQQGIHEQVFQVNDILRLRDGTNDTWVKVVSVTDETTNYAYTVEYQSGTTGVTYYAGQAVADYGNVNNRAGHIIISADDTYSPYISLRTHDGTPWTTIRELLKIGNLDGSWGYTTTKYGVAIGEYNSGKANIILDEDGVLRIRSYTNDVIRIDTNGVFIGDTTRANVHIDTNGVLRLRNATADAIKIDTGGILIGNASAANVHIDTSGVLRLRNATADAIKIDTSGILIGNASAANVFIGTSGELKIRSGTNDIIALTSNDARITNVIRLSDSMSALSIGQVPPTSSSSGTGIWIDRNGFYILKNDVRNMTIDTDGIVVGTSNNVVVAKVDPSGYRLWIGNVDPNLAPFAVRADGTVYARNVNYASAIVDRGGVAQKHTNRFKHACGLYKCNHKHDNKRTTDVVIVKWRVYLCAHKGNLCD